MFKPVPQQATFALLWSVTGLLRWAASGGQTLITVVVC